jgi:hypothetical protein
MLLSVSLADIAPSSPTATVLVPTRIIPRTILVGAPKIFVELAVVQFNPSGEVDGLSSAVAKNSVPVHNMHRIFNSGVALLREVQLDPVVPVELPSSVLPSNTAEKLVPDHAKPVIALPPLGTGLTSVQLAPSLE